MKILVTGATGFVGTKLTELALKENHEVIALGRSPEKIRTLLGPRVLARSWPKLTEMPHPNVFDSVDAVIHLAGEGIADQKWTEKRKEDIYQSRVTGTRLLVSALKQSQNPPQCFVAASAIGFYGDRGEETLTESSPAGHGYLSHVCHDWEKETQGAQPCRYHSVRLGVVFGRRGGALAQMLPLFRLGLGGPLGSGKQWMSWIHLEDAARIFLYVVTSLRTSGIVNAVSPNPIRNAAFANALGHAVHRPALLRVPQWVLRWTMGELSSAVLASQRVLPQVLQGCDFSFSYPDLANALATVV